MAFNADQELAGMQNQAEMSTACSGCSGSALESIYASWSRIIHSYTSSPWRISESPPSICQGNFVALSGLRVFSAPCQASLWHVFFLFSWCACGVIFSVDDPRPHMDS